MKSETDQHLKWFLGKLWVISLPICDIYTAMQMLCYSLPEHLLKGLACMENFCGIFC